LVVSALSRMSKQDEELLQRIDEVLHYIWDPIGISSNPHARDEYRSYALPLFSLLKSASTEAQIADWLSNIRKDTIGMPPNRRNDQVVAILLLDWKEMLRLASTRRVG
jgi:hypothetical protein